MGCRVFHGPYVYNFQEVYDLLSSYGVAEEINNEKELAKKLIKNFGNPIIEGQKQINLLNSYGERILKETALEIDLYLK